MNAKQEVRVFPASKWMAARSPINAPIFIQLHVSTLWSHHVDEFWNILEEL